MFDTDGKKILELSGEIQSRDFSISGTEEFRNSLIVANGDAGLLTMWQKIKGETGYRSLFELDLSSNTSNHVFTEALSIHCQYKFTCAGADKLSLSVTNIQYLD